MLPNHSVGRLAEKPRSGIGLPSKVTVTLIFAVGNLRVLPVPLVPITASIALYP